MQKFHLLKQVAKAGILVILAFDETNKYKTN
ncbi:MAG: hypothetical protein JWQ79_1039 [Mucilaginibacter sp.]|jgi:hypothetical protein|nr:hypothetical protein [Mucilaginibacter sp.]